MPRSTVLRSFSRPTAEVRRRVRHASKIAACWAIDIAAAVAGKRDPLVPPTRLMFDGPRGTERYRRGGQETLSSVVDVGGLKPTDAVLDVGSGIGRKTLPLTGYLTGEARYDGLEIVKAGVTWCAEHITPRFPNFRFHHADVYNRHYNPRGRTKASAYRFPFPDATYDFVLLTSVFTHMVAADVRNYVDEIARVLKPGGRAFITYYLVTERAKAAVDAGRSVYRFPLRTEEYWAENPFDPEEVTAYEEAFIDDLYSAAGLTIVNARYGRWSDGVDHGQDIVVAVKR